MIAKKRLIPYFENLIPGPTIAPDPGWFAQEQAHWNANPVSAPAPTPPPAVPQADPSKTKIGAKGKEIPVGVHGNRLDTAAGRAKEAKMLQDEQIRIATHAFVVAESERTHGREQSSRDAQQLAVNAINTASSYNQGRATTGFFDGVRKSHQPTTKQIVRGTSKELEDYRNRIISFDPTVSKSPEDPGDPGDDDPKPKQPTTGRITAPITAPSPPKPKIVKNPNRDVLDLSRDEFSISSVSRLLFEQVGSIELVNIARRDTIEGQNPYYSMISNLSTVRKNFDPTSIITRQKSNQGIYSNYNISLNDKIPDDQYLERNNLTDFYYIDDNGDLVIELDNLASDEIIDFEIAESGTINLVDEA